jgi:hypothetical protein
MDELRKAAEALAHWPESTCVECGRKMPSGRQQKCNSSMGGVCNWHIPGALLRQMYKLAAALAQTQGEPEQSLVERALDAWYTDGESKPYDDLQRSCMADAGRVFMEAALAEPEMREINAAFWKDDDNYASAAKRLFANRHLQILGQLESLPATEDAPVERVTIHSRSGGEYHEVKLDGKLQCTFGGFDLKTAERYAAGLRKELADAK